MRPGRGRTPPLLETCRAPLISGALDVDRARALAGIFTALADPKRQARYRRLSYLGRHRQQGRMTRPTASHLLTAGHRRPAGHRPTAG
jgi:hypothetical protein